MTWEKEQFLDLIHLLKLKKKRRKICFIWSSEAKSRRVSRQPLNALYFLLGSHFPHLLLQHAHKLSPLCESFTFNFQPGFILPLPSRLRFSWQQFHFDFVLMAEMLKPEGETSIVYWGGVIEHVWCCRSYLCHYTLKSGGVDCIILGWLNINFCLEFLLVVI